VSTPCCPTCALTSDRPRDGTNDRPRGSSCPGVWPDRPTQGLTEYGERELDAQVHHSDWGIRWVGGPDEDVHASRVRQKTAEDRSDGLHADGTSLLYALPSSCAPGAYLAGSVPWCGWLTRLNIGNAAAACQPPRTHARRTAAHTELELGEHAVAVRSGLHPDRLVALAVEREALGGARGELGAVACGLARVLRPPPEAHCPAPSVWGGRGRGGRAPLERW
jgi:hypothetical protein